MRFVPAPEYPVFPTRERPLQPYEAVVQAVAADAAGGRRGPARRRRPRHPHARPGAGRRAGGGAGGDADPPRLSGRRPRLAAVRVRGPARRAPRVGPRRCGGRLTGRCASGLSAGRARAQRRPAARSAWRPVERFHGGLSQQLCMVGTLPAARVSARVARARPRRRAADVGAAVRGRCSRRPATRRSCWWRPPPPRIPSTGCCAPRWPGLGGEPVRVLATWNRRPLPGPGARSPANTRLVEWLSYAQTMPRVARSSSATPATARWCGRSPPSCRGAGRAPRRRHGRERRPRRLVRRRRAAALAAAVAAHAAPGRPPRAGRARAGGARGAAGRLGGASTRAPPGRPTSSSSWPRAAAAAGRGVGGRGVG